MKQDWWYHLWWRGYSGRIHKLKGKVRLGSGDTLIKKDGSGLPPAIRYHIQKVKKARRIRKGER